MKHPILLSALFLFISGSLFAQPGAPMEKHEGKNRDGREGRHPAAMLKEKIGLSDDQLKKLETIRIGARKTMETGRHEIEMEKLTLKELAVAGTLTKARIKESLKKTDDLMQKIHAARFQAANAALDVFTDEQVKKLADNKMLGEFMLHGDMPPDCPAPDKCPMKKGKKPDHD